MALAHTLLTSLLEKPSTGYELARRFDRSIGYFWHASHQQIYRELAKMLSQGWISTDDLSQNSTTRPRKSYQVEKLGKEELYQWMTNQQQPSQLREELMVRLRAEAIFQDNTLLPELERHLKLHTHQLNLYSKIHARDYQKDQKLSRTDFIHCSILELGILFEKNWIEWLDGLISQLKSYHEI